MAGDFGKQSDGAQSERSVANARRVVSRGGTAQVVRLGLAREFGSDSFHRFMRLRWRWAIAAIAGVYLLANLCFALAYWFAGDVIQHARPGSFLDAFFFSLQTMATVGYGQFYPVGTLANAIASFEAFTGLLGFAIGAGLVFAKFARPTAKIGFSRTAVVHERNGQPCLAFRMVNERNNQILEASLSATALMNTVTREGDALRTMHDMKLQRSRTAIFALTWTAVHPLDKDSPLYGLSREALAASAMEIIVSFTGLDDAVNASISARHSYVVDELEWNRRFTDILSRGPLGQAVIDYGKFHLTEDAAKAAETN